MRIVARDVPYYSNDSHWWSPDTYFKGGQLSASQEPANGTEDPEFYETERWGHFSYAIPVAPGRYTVTVHFIEHRADAEAPPAERSAELQQLRGSRVQRLLQREDDPGQFEHIPTSWRESSAGQEDQGLEPNAQGKLLLEFVPVTRTPLYRRSKLCRTEVVG